MLQADRNWAPWQEEVLRIMLPHKDISYDVMAKVVGRTRSAVCGKVQRMGLADRQPKAQPVMRNKIHLEPPSDSETARILERHQAEAAQRTLKTLIDLEDNECHFVIGDPAVSKAVYCGKPSIPGRQYCRCCNDRMIERIEVKRFVPAPIRELVTA